MAPRTTNAGDSLAFNPVNPGNFLQLTDEARKDIIRAVATEADHRLASNNPDEYKRQVAGIVDTILNRTQSPEYPDTVREVLNQRNQFSAINGPRGRGYEVFGSVQNVPDNRIPEGLPDVVNGWIDQRVMGTPSSVGGGLNYANPSYSDASNRAWVNALDGPRFGEGDRVHYHGTTRGSTPFEATLGGSIPADYPAIPVNPALMPPGLRQGGFAKLPDLAPASDTSLAFNAETPGNQTAGGLDIRTAQTVPIDPQTGLPVQGGGDRSIGGMPQTTDIMGNERSANWRDKSNAAIFNRDPSLMPNNGTGTGAPSTKQMGGALRSALDKLRVSATNRTSAPGAGLTQAQRSAMSATPSGGGQFSASDMARGNTQPVYRPGDVAMPAGVVPASVQRDLPQVIAGHQQQQNLGSMPSYGDVQQLGGTLGQMPNFNEVAQLPGNGEPEFITKTIRELSPTQDIPNTPENMPLGMQLHSGSRDSIAQAQLGRDVAARADWTQQPQYVEREIQVANPNYVAPQAPAQMPMQGPPQLLGPAAPGIVKKANPMQQVVQALMGSPQRGASPQQMNPVVQALMGQGGKNTIHANPNKYGDTFGARSAAAEYRDQRMSEATGRSGLAASSGPQSNNNSADSDARYIISGNMPEWLRASLEAANKSRGYGT